MTPPARPRIATSLHPALLSLVLVVASGCTTGTDAPSATEHTSPAHQTAFRVRSDIGAGLNANQGWAGPPNQAATLPVEAPFRLRFEVETPLDTPFIERFRLQYRRNDGRWRPVPAADFPYAPAEITPRVSVVSTSAYNHLADATDLLDGSTASYAGGKGMRLSGQGPALPDHGVQSEWEWPLVIRRYADGAVTNEAGDRFAFRLVDVTGRPLPAPATPEVTASVPPRLLGGTFPETPGRLGPWAASDGSLYFLMEPAESYNKLMTVKSTDGGQTWQEMDGARRPATGDLEGFASALHAGTIHMLHQIDAGVLHHSFRTADHSRTPDAWAVRDDTVATPGAPPVQVRSPPSLRGRTAASSGHTAVPIASTTRFVVPTAPGGRTPRFRAKLGTRCPARKRRSGPVAQCTWPTPAATAPAGTAAFERTAASRPLRTLPPISGRPRPTSVRSSRSCTCPNRTFTAGPRANSGRAAWPTMAR